MICTVILVAGFYHSAQAASAPAKLDHAASMYDKLAGNWKKHTITRLDPSHPALKMPALFQWVSDSWNRVGLYPFMCYMPEKNRLFAAVGGDVAPHKPYVITSDDGGATWTEPRHISPHATTGLSAVCYLGDGQVIVTTWRYQKRHYSDDYGQTFPHNVAMDSVVDGQERHDSGIPYVDRNPKTGRIDRLIGIRYEHGYQKKPSQPYIRFSTNRGKTWTKDRLIPQWTGFNEIEMMRAKNGDLICALRSDIHKRYKNRNDHFGGMGVSISKDNGETWSDVNLLYEWGRHHPSPVLMPDGRIVITYVVREGYPPNENGYPTFGIEAIVSSDHGQTWDLDYLYVLHEWDGYMVGDKYWEAGPQITSTVLLPDGDLLTIFGSGEREPGFVGDPRHIGLIRWRLADIDQPDNVVQLDK